MATNRRKWILGTLGLLVPLSILLISELHWTRLNNPEGKFATVSEYLELHPSPRRIAVADKSGRRFFIAYGSLGSGFALKSGPPAYVFDNTGELVDWTKDSGDDPAFQSSWPVSEQQQSSLTELRKFGSNDTE